LKILEELNRGDHARWLLFVVFYAIVANLPFWTASPFLGLMRNGLFCLEYVGVGLLALFLPRIVAGVLLLLAITADLIGGVSQTFYISPAECLRSSSFLYLLSGTRLLMVAGVAILSLLVAAFAAFFPIEKIRDTHRLFAAMCLVAFAVVSLTADCVTMYLGTGRLPNPFRLSIPTDSAKLSYLEKLSFSRLPAIRLVRNEIRGNVVQALAAETDASLVSSSTAVAVRSAGITVDESNRQKPNLVVVLVESWGLVGDSSIRGALAQPYFQPDLIARYEVSQGTVPFYGPTLAGEARELCESKIGFHLLNASAQELQGCLPDRLVALGYHSIALHGMDGHMFNRLKWYRSIGFQERWFRDQFRQQGLPDCVGAFTGTCDAAIAEWIRSRLERQDENPNFVYWMTLNSHLPVPTPAPLAGGDSCSFAPLLSQQSAFCSWYQLVANVHHSVSKIAMSKLARPTVFVIVGDHPPGFANPLLRGQFASEVVPYVVLVPRRDVRGASLSAGSHDRPPTAAARIGGN
jgi:phosphoglycerol transferase MdoB-like AlkP superfamily enzyme